MVTDRAVGPDDAVRRDDDLLAKSPMRSVKKPKATRTRPWVALTEQQVQQLIATLKSDAFKDKILSLGGYTVENPGEIIPLD